MKGKKRRNNTRIKWKYRPWTALVVSGRYDIGPKEVVVDRRCRFANSREFFGAKQVVGINCAPIWMVVWDHYSHTVHPATWTETAHRCDRRNNNRQYQNNIEKHQQNYLKKKYISEEPHTIDPVCVGRVLVVCCPLFLSGYICLFFRQTASFLRCFFSIGPLLMCLNWQNRAGFVVSLGFGSKFL